MHEVTRFDNTAWDRIAKIRAVETCGFSSTCYRYEATRQKWSHSEQDNIDITPVR